MATKQRPAFSLRFSQPEVHRAAQAVASHRHMSLNAFVEEAVEAHLMVEGPLVAQELRAAMDVVRSYTAPDVGRAIDELAAGEVAHDDLLRPEGMPPEEADHYGIKAAFGEAQSLR
jgi:hypothetical protein